MRSKSNKSALTFERELPDEKAYHFSNGPKHESPCMSSYWRSIPIRQGQKKEES